MRNFKILFPILLFSMSLFVVACGGGSAENSNNTSTEVSHDGHDHDGHSHDDSEASDHDHDGADHDHATPTPHGKDSAFTSAYVCPMHCPKSGSSEAGKCPACGMDYVAYADHVKDGHTH